MFRRMYEDGEYLKRNPTWHVEDSPWKARQIIRMIERNHLEPKTVCEVGCGAGEILRQLQVHMSNQCIFWGYEISPQAFELSEQRANERLHFELRDFSEEQNVVFDLILLIDLIEHLEDYFSLLRKVGPTGDYKILHIPLEVTVQAVLRGKLPGRRSTGHIHYFTKRLALQILRDVGLQVLDWFSTPAAVERPPKSLRTRIAEVPRRLLFLCDDDLAVRALGGWSLMVLAR